MSQALILETHLKKLRLPSMLKHYHKLAADAAQHNKTHEQFLVMLLDEEMRSRRKTPAATVSGRRSFLSIRP